MPFLILLSLKGIYWQADDIDMSNPLTQVTSPVKRGTEGWQTGAVLIDWRRQDGFARWCTGRSYALKSQPNTRPETQPTRSSLTVTLLDCMGARTLLGAPGLTRSK